MFKLFPLKIQIEQENQNLFQTNKFKHYVKLKFCLFGVKICMVLSTLYKHDKGPLLRQWDKKKNCLSLVKCNFHFHQIRNHF